MLSRADSTYGSDIEDINEISANDMINEPNPKRMKKDLDSNTIEYIREITPMNYNDYELIKSKSKHSKKDIETTFKKITVLNIDKTWKLDTVNIFDISHNRFNQDIYTFINLEKLIINKVVISELPDFTQFCKLKHLDLSHTKVAKLFEGKRINFPITLEFLSMCNCNLSSIPEEVYTLINLTELYFIDNNIKVISNGIGNLTKLKYLNFGNNKIYSISPYFAKLEKLECLSFNNNPIKVVDCKITKLLNLQKLLLNNCGIITIDISFGNLVNVLGLDLGNNPGIGRLPTTITNLKKMNDFNLDNTGLIEIPDNLFTLTAIERIKISQNPIYTIPDSIGNMVNLKFFEIYNTNVEYLPESMGNITSMEDLYLHFNKIKEIPSSFEKLVNLKNFVVNDNDITDLPPMFENLTKLSNLNISNNNILVLPTNIINAKGLLTLNYSNNPIFTIQPQVKRFIDNITNGRNFVRDSQSIHNTTVQKNLIKSIENLTSQKIVIDNLKISHQIINDPILTEPCKKMIEKEFLNNEVHYVLQLNFKEIFSYVWTYIMETEFDKETQNEIKQIINQELLESKDLCFIGKITRLVSSLNGFCNIIKITVSDSEYISNTISNIKNTLDREGKYTVEKHRELVREDLKQYGISNDNIETWVEYIE